MTFDPFTAAKLQRKVELTAVDTTVDDVRRLAGLGHGAPNQGPKIDQTADLRRIERERNIKPGTQEWFRLWFAKPTLTGERPYDESQ